MKINLIIRIKSPHRPLLKMQVDDHFSKGNRLNGDGKEEKDGAAEADRKEVEKLIKTVTESQ